jgi:hypothetical protein
MRPHSLLDVTPNMFEGFAAIANVKVGNPSPQGKVDFFDHPVKRHECPPPSLVRTVTRSLIDLSAFFEGWTWA